MFRFSKVAMAAATLSTGLFLAGCASENKSADSSGMQMGSSSTMQMGQGVACSKCQMTWAKIPDTGGKSRIVGYKTSKSMECPDCKTAVANFFSTGKLEHTCKMCGDSMEICETH